MNNEREFRNTEQFKVQKQAREKEQFFTILKYRIPIFISNQGRSCSLVDFWKNRDHGRRRLLGREAQIYSRPTKFLEILTETPMMTMGEQLRTLAFFSQ
jgi:hypothetical protein